MIHGNEEGELSYGILKLYYIYDGVMLFHRVSNLNSQNLISDSTH
jgi:hypothetical protein